MNQTATVHIVLVEPEIPANTGNIARTCAATKTSLHLIRPLGFSLEDRYLRRAGLDYWGAVQLTVYDAWEAYVEAHPQQQLWLATTKASRLYTEVAYTGAVSLVFGKETAGLPPSLLATYAQQCIRLPMTGDVRSLNVANATAVVLYEVLRQRGFPSLT